MKAVCKCGSYAINHHCHGRDGSDGDLCDVCYWRKRAEQPAQQDEFKAAYIEAMVASNEAGFAGMSAAETIRELSRMVAEQPARQEPVGRLESDPDEGHVFVPRIDGDWSMLGEDLYTSPQPAQQEPVAVPTTSYEHRKFVLVGRKWYERFAAFHDDCQIGERLTREEQTVRQQGYENGWNDAQRYLREPQASPPAQRKPLTDHQTMSMTFNHHWLTSMTLRDAYRLGIRDAEAAHGITKGTK